MMLLSLVWMVLTNIHQSGQGIGLIINYIQLTSFEEKKKNDIGKQQQQPRHHKQT